MAIADHGYSITDEGLAALREWLATSVSSFAMEFEALIRIVMAPLGIKDRPAHDSRARRGRSA
jgi:DNA-binding PadR family transcriptional regulator